MIRRNLPHVLSRPHITFRRLSTGSWVALAVVMIVALAAVFAPLVANHDPLELGAKAVGPAQAHWLGTDQLGRDIFSRLVYGSRWSLAIGLGATLFALLCGAIIGSFAATTKRAVDEVVMRILDMVMAFPGIALAAVLVSVFGRAVPVLIMAIGFLYIPTVARLVRANVLAEYREDYVQAERAIGARRTFVLARHVAINCAAPVVVFCTILVADAIVFEASLSFVGAGIAPPNPSWGSVLSDGKNMVLTGGWWATLFPGLIILVTVLALNILSEGLSDAWAAPSTRDPGVGIATTGSDTSATVTRVTATPALSAVTPDETPAPPGDQLIQAGRRLTAHARRLDGEPEVLRVKDLAISFASQHRGVNVVDRVSFTVRRHEVVGLIGESGCGKSLTSLAIMGLEPRGARVTGEVLFEGRDLLRMSGRERRGHLGRDISMIYQDALSSLNPAMTVKAQLKQFVRRGGTRTITELLQMVNLDPDRTLRSYPHELSGGQRQRALIAMALSRSPKLIIADEPTTALDVTVQAQIVRLLLRLQEELGFALVFVSHDLALVADIADQILVMYGGQIAESGPAAQLIANPRHHYTRGLLGAVLSSEEPGAELIQIEGVVPPPSAFGPGCRFAPRCPAAADVCLTTPPVPHADGAHLVACHLPAPSMPEGTLGQTSPDHIRQGSMRS